MTIERLLAAQRLFGAQCSWCGHAQHAEVCPRTITRPAKRKTDKAEERPCPCKAGAA